MKKTFAILLSGLCALAASSAVLADEFDDFYDSADERGEWWEKQGYFFAEGYYTQLQELKGGGGAAGGEYVNNVVHFGAGARMSLGYLMHDYDEGDVTDTLIGFDLYMPIRINDAITVYGGGGVNVHNLEFELDGGGPMSTGDGDRITENAFAGLRWRYQHMYVFGEYRHEFGDVRVHFDTYGGNREYRKVNMSDDRFLVGAGFVF